MITVMRLQKELDIPIILSGGKVFEDTGREADIEKRIFEGMGVNSQALILENQSRNTVENVQNSKVIMEEYNFTKPLVITSGFHLPRAMEIFAREGIESLKCWYNIYLYWDKDRMRSINLLTDYN